MFNIDSFLNSVPLNSFQSNNSIYIIKSCLIPKIYNFFYILHLQKRNMVHTYKCCLSDNKSKIGATSCNFYLVSLGFTWIHLDSLGFTWTRLDSLGSTWTHLDSLKGKGKTRWGQKGKGKGRPREFHCISTRQTDRAHARTNRNRNRFPGWGYTN